MIVMSRHTIRCPESGMTVEECYCTVCSDFEEPTSLLFDSYDEDYDLDEWGHPLDFDLDDFNEDEELWNEEDD